MSQVPTAPLTPPEAQAGKMVQEAGFGPRWNVADLPPVEPFSFKQALRMFGPGILLLSSAIGGGEWLMGPAAVVKFGPVILWIATVSIITQVFFNLECIRYTHYTGEPAMVGFTRLWPGPKLWTPVWLLLSFLSLASPAWAISAATAASALFLGRIPGAEDQAIVYWVGILLFAFVVLILSTGGKIEALLEKINKWIVGFILISVTLLSILLVPFKVWWEVFLGFFSFGSMPEGVDWFLLGGLAAYAGGGCVSNIALSNWFRDKGYAMGGIAGYISSWIGGHQVRVSNVGTVFPINEKNMTHWRNWWKFTLFDQAGVWMIGAFLGMYLCVVLAYGLLPKGFTIGGWGVAAHQADAVAKAFGPIGWYWVLLIGLWVLWGSQLVLSDSLVRQATDLIWCTSDWVRTKWAKEDIRRIYYAILFLFVVWSMVVSKTGLPMFLMTFIANTGNLVFLVGGIQVLFMRRLLPKELRPSLVSTLIIIFFVLFFGWICILGFGTLFGFIK